MLEIKDIEVSYDREPVIQNLSTVIYPSSFVGLIGPNGAGKTTLLLSISGQFRPQKGQIYFNKNEIYDYNIEFKRVIGYVHENPFFYPYLTAEDFLRFVAGVKEVPEDQTESQITFHLKLVGIWEERYKLTSHFSMGMRKKLAIAAALLGSPRILFLDEALAGVDFESAFKIKNELKDFVARGGTVILSTHVLEVVEKLCDRYLILKSGKIIADLKAEELRNSDTSKKVKDLDKFIMQLLQS